MTNLRINVLDIDECLNYPCQESATCINNIGSFDCECKEGFMGNGSMCEGKMFLPYSSIKVNLMICSNIPFVLHYIV